MQDGTCSSNEIALMKIVEARMKMIKEALPSMSNTLLTTSCPTKAAIVASRTK